jgi:hypothetical protein
LSTVRIRIRADYFATLKTALGKAEEVVFAYATYTDGIFEIDRLEIMIGEDVEYRSDWHVTLADDVRPRIIKAAWDCERCLIEAHSHGPRGFAEFSGSDLAGFEEWVKHVRWRLHGRPYAALVLAGETWDALAWVDGAEPTTVEAITVINNGEVVETIEPTNATATKLARRKRS